MTATWQRHGQPLCPPWCTHPLTCRAAVRDGEWAIHHEGPPVTVKIDTVPVTVARYLFHEPAAYAWSPEMEAVRLSFDDYLEPRPVELELRPCEVQALRAALAEVVAQLPAEARQ